MDYIEGIIRISEYMLNSKERRHVVGGILLSVSALFCGLAITTMTYHREENDDDDRQ